MKKETLEEAAERFYPINSTGGEMEMLNKHQLNNSYKQEGFIVGDIGLPQHLYILSNDEIKEGDWFIQVNTKKRIKHHPKNGLLLQPQKFDKKVILTTDLDLIKDGVHAIGNPLEFSKNFDEWFEQFKK
jgi:hypothetical protein